MSAQNFAPACPRRLITPRSCRRPPRATRGLRPGRSTAAARALLRMPCRRQRRRGIEPGRPATRARGRRRRSGALKGDSANSRLIHLVAAIDKADGHAAGRRQADRGTNRTPACLDRPGRRLGPTAPMCSILAWNAPAITGPFSRCDGDAVPPFAQPIGVARRSIDSFWRGWKPPDLQPAAPADCAAADPAQLLRRRSDLPPTPEEIADVLRRGRT